MRQGPRPALQCPLTVECDNEDFKEIVENWLKKAVPHSFRKQWFLEYFRSSMVPVLKTLIPTSRRDYKSRQDPTDQRAVGSRRRWNVPLARRRRNADDRASSAEATQRVIEKAGRTPVWILQGDGRRTSRPGDSFKQGLCSEARLHKLRARAAQIQYKWLAGNIAASYTILDPARHLDGRPAGDGVAAPALPDDGRGVRGGHRESQAAAGRDDRQVADGHRPSDPGGRHTKIWLSPNICTVTYGEKQPYERYPTPIVIHADEALKLKMMLYQMDKAVAKSVRDKILKVTIGNDEYPAFDEGQIRPIAAIFNNPSRNLTIFWNHTLECEWVEPKDTSLADEKKYTHVNNEIRTAFGISAMITGTGDKNCGRGRRHLEPQGSGGGSRRGPGHLPGMARMRNRTAQAGPGGRLQGHGHVRQDEPP